LSRKTGTPNAITKNMKDVLELAFNRSGGVDYLCRVAENDPKTFCALLARLVPNTVQLDVKVAMDLGLAMRESQQNLERLNHKIIDVKPAQPAKSLITKE